MHEQSLPENMWAYDVPWQDLVPQMESKVEISLPDSQVSFHNSSCFFQFKIFFFFQCLIFKERATWSKLQNKLLTVRQGRYFCSIYIVVMQYCSNVVLQYYVVMQYYIVVLSFLDFNLILSVFVNQLHFIDAYTDLKVDVTNPSRSKNETWSF